MRNINNLRYSADTTLMAESEEEVKSLLMRVKKQSERASLRLNIKKLRSWHLMANRFAMANFMANRREKGGSSDRFPLLDLQNHCGR